jgi:phosphatidyl-myo-inositol dimannoside synthase
VFVLTSINQEWRFEGFGLVLLEAGAAGLPVIGTRDCGVEDAIDEGVTGLLVPQEGVESALATAILSLLRDPRQREIIGSAGRVKTKKQTWDAVAAQMTALYGRALMVTQQKLGPN